MSQSLTSLRSCAVQDIWEAGPAPCGLRLLDCRRCSHLSASTSYSDSQRFLLLQSRQQSRLHRTRTLSTAVSNEDVVVTEHKATESMREALKDTGPVKDLGYLLAGKTVQANFLCCSQYRFVAHRFPHDFEAHYKLEEEIGKGAWATVNLATELKTGEKYVLQIVLQSMSVSSVCVLAYVCMQTGRQDTGKMD